MPNLKMLNSTKYLYKLTFIKCSYEPRYIVAFFLQPACIDFGANKGSGQ